MKKTEPVIFLIGGKGSRMSSLHKNNHLLPKALIKINSVPLIMHSIKNFIDYDYNNLIFALGFKGNTIKNFFIKKKSLFGYKFNLFTDIKEYETIINTQNNYINIFLVNTGINSNKTKECGTD